MHWRLCSQALCDTFLIGRRYSTVEPPSPQGEDFPSAHRAYFRPRSNSSLGSAAGSILELMEDL